ncbi:zinc metalloprotease HtpX [soil metagenome]
MAPVLIEEAIRLNRRRIVAMAAAAAVNYWVVVTFLAWIILWGKVDRSYGIVELWTSAAAGAVVAMAIVGSQVRSIRPRTVAQLGAVEISRAEFPAVENLLAELAIAVGTAPVRAALLVDNAPNALTVGRTPSDTTIVVTTGLIEGLTRDELEGVLAAELWAVRRFDTAMQSVTVACTGSAIAAHHDFREDWQDPRVWLLIAGTWPTMVFAELLRRSILRNCDFGADAMAVATTRHPEALRLAMQRLRDDEVAVEVLEARTAPLWFEPVPHDDGRRAREFQRIALTPTLDERISQLPDHAAPPHAPT